MSDFCTCGQQKTLELDYVVKEDETEEVLPPVEETEKAEEEEVEEEVVEEPDEEKELLDEEKGYARKDMAALASLLKQVLKNLEEEGEEEEDEEKDMHMEEEKNMHYDEEKEMDEEVPMAEPMLEEEEVSMSVKEALKTLEKSGMSVYAGKKTTPATRRVVREKPVAINWSEFSKSVDEIHRMEERTGVN